MQRDKDPSTQLNGASGWSKSVGELVAMGRLLQQVVSFVDDLSFVLLMRFSTIHSYVVRGFHNGACAVLFYVGTNSIDWLQVELAGTTHVR